MQQTNITKEQLKKIHVLLSQLHLMDEKKDIIKAITGNRTESSRELTYNEAKVLLGRLSVYDSNNRMRRKVFALAYEAGIIWGDTPEDKRMNAAKLNTFLKARGTVKKELNALTANDLVKTISQFQQIVKHKGENSAAKQTRSLLAELNIESSMPQRAKAL